jgi:phosphoribosyl-AMP cyclohydrolase / phosphoribosyl-ATP pyrophosphohydrolase
VSWESIVENVRFDLNGLVPAIVQDVRTKEVLTLAYMNKESLIRSMETRQTWFYSRSRQELWHKGETSGNVQHIVNMSYDCDRDAILVQVIPEGPACHHGTTSCFDEPFFQTDRREEERATISILMLLDKRIEKRKLDRPEGAYTTYLFNEGIDKIGKKIGEEAAEVIIAAKNRNKEEVKWEVADLFYHILVLLQEQQVPLDDIWAVLKKRYDKG